MSEHSGEKDAALLDLRDRLKRADQELRDMSVVAESDQEAARLSAKADGVRLALSYIREAFITCATPPAR